MPDQVLVDAVNTAVSSVGDLEPEGRIWVGFSGGADSTALLLACQAAFPDRVCAIHVDHQLQSASADWVRHCVEFATSRRIPIETRAVSVSVGNVEGAARAARYQVFDDLVGPGEILLLAHHRNDQSETLLLRLFQGRGLVPMAQVRRLRSGAVVSRPFLKIQGDHLRSALKQEGIAWLSDPSNESDGLDRNFLRNQVLPIIRQRWPDVDQRLDRVASYSEALENLAARGHGESIGIDELRDVPPVQASVDLRLWLRKLGEFQVTDRALIDYLQQVASGTDRQPNLKLHNGSLKRYRERIYYVREIPGHAAHYSCEPPAALALPHGSLKISAVASGGFALNKSLEICFDQLKARIVLSGGSKTAARVLSEGGIPPWLRPHYPLLFSDGVLIAIPGLAHHQRTGPGWVAQWRFDAGSP
ncbi:MAG: tRNA lysidine(34) synthetase TilS [Proteobacteria bacterium]|nr:tRNA lysidine(34) synthetase TilS [Pseudomonadota bacterium]